MILYTAIIPINPVTKKNSQHIYINRSTGRPFITPSDAYKRYESQAIPYLSRNLISTIQCACNVRVRFYMATRRKCDLVNLLESVDDLLVKRGVLADDNYTIIASHNGSRVFVDKLHPRTEILIEKLEE